jgi:hypothetical protein
MIIFLRKAKIYFADLLTASLAQNRVFVNKKETAQNHIFNKYKPVPNIFYAIPRRPWQGADSATRF